MLETIREMFRFGATAHFTYRSDRAASVFGGGSASSAGINVSQEKALNYSPWWRGIQIVSDAIARTQVSPYRITAAEEDLEDEDDDAIKTLAKEHASYPLLKREPNFFQTAYQWKKLMVSHKLSNGNAYSYIIRDGMTPVQLVPLDPHSTTPVIVRQDGSYWPTIPSPGDSIWYVWWQQGKAPVWLPAEDVLHFRNLSAEGVWGYSVVQKAREALGLGIAQQTHASVFFSNGAKPGLVLTHPNKLTDETKNKLLESWQRRHAGPENQLSTAIIDNGLDIKEVAFSAADSQLIESREFSIRDVANYLGVPAHKLGDTSKTGYASLEQENLSFISDTLSSHYVEFEEELQRKLLTEAEKAADSHVIEFADAAFRGADLNTKANFISKALGGAPFLSVDEGRSIIGLNPSGDPKHREIAVPLNQGKTSDQQNQDQQDAEDSTDPPPRKSPPADQGAKAVAVEPSKAIVGAAYRMAHATCKRLATRAAHQATAAAKTPDKFLAFADEYEQANKATALEEFEPAEDAVRAATGKAPHFASRFVAHVAQQMRSVAARATAKTLQSEVAAACGSLADTIGKEIGEQR